MIVDDAIAAERQGLIERAADLYEEALEENALPAWALTNMIVLYWQVTDFGFWAGMHLPESFVHRAGKRLRYLLSLAQTRFPENREARFWSYYIAWADGESFDIQDCERMLEEDPGNLIPAFFLYSQSSGSKYEAEALRVLEMCKSEGTLKAAYVVSVVEATLSRKGRTRS